MRTSCDCRMNWREPRTASQWSAAATTTRCRTTTPPSSYSPEAWSPPSADSPEKTPISRPRKLPVLFLRLTSENRIVTGEPRVNYRASPDPGYRDKSLPLGLAAILGNQRPTKHPSKVHFEPLDRRGVSGVNLKGGHFVRRKWIGIERALLAFDALAAAIQEITDHRN